MLRTSLTNIQTVSAHFVGNALNGEPLKLSEAPLALGDEQIHEMLCTYFLSNFTMPEFYSFTADEDDFSKNPMYQIADEMFRDPESFHKNSIAIAELLSSVTQNPNIKSGEVYVAFIESIQLDDFTADAIGIFKSENKENFLKLSTVQWHLQADQGINVKRLDKGCLIVNTGRDSGYKVMIVDNTNRSDTAHFWKQNFLAVKPWSDAFHHTSTFMQMTQQYIEDKLGDEFAVSKADKIDLLNRSVDFFKSREEFDKSEFETSVLGDPDVIESFRNFGKNSMVNKEIDEIDHFEISVPAVKATARIFKSVLKLDKNFHIYIHGGKEQIEKGYDEVTGRHYYKLYFNSES
jgi:hypothetical protein